MSKQLYHGRPASILFGFLGLKIICFSFFGNSGRPFSNFEKMLDIMYKIQNLEVFLEVEGF
jgi:hypothetical protein